MALLDGGPAHGLVCKITTETDVAWVTTYTPTGGGKPAAIPLPDVPDEDARPGSAREMEDLLDWAAGTWSCYERMQTEGGPSVFTHLRRRGLMRWAQ